jgi:hypothetical protein
VIERELQDAEGAIAIRSSHGYFGFVVPYLNHTAGNLFSGFEIVEQQLAVSAQRPGDAEGHQRFELLVGAVLLANNLMRIAALLTKRTRRKRKAA